ncbi:MULTISPECIES: LysR family transcriptional regulator [unclassified Roseateles]|uniref:LysR family transcriptional regulator n=1 Tax=unclassified Roseateles TaxID=2626991 RepID=UPI0006F2B9B5|nr:MULTISPECIES: LysR family transcriptional regulator [unclassified Roseateles]KQW43821.1 LysR family transcriptional regulator [Pelomonas sp. Root405]KRA71570.1 LysR family transcriptional regulator [Pelomonas sp. Root662]
MEFRHLRYFIALAEELHFGRAAQRLAISQPPLSVAIQQLEANVGARLFDRDSKGVRLTPAGVAFRSSAQGLLDRAEDACALAREVQAGEVGRLRLGFVGSTLFNGLSAWLQAFQASHPKVEVVVVELNSQDQINALLGEELDLGLVHTDRLPPTLISQPLYSEPFLACLPANHPAAKLKEIPLALLSDQPFILFSRKGSPDYHARIVEICRQHGFYPRLQHEGRHWLSVVSLVAQGMGVSIVPAAFQRSGIQGATFRPLAEAIESSAVFAAWRQNSADPLIQRFLSMRTIPNLLI